MQGKGEGVFLIPSVLESQCSAGDEPPVRAPEPFLVQII
jgi:hypothetical protein